EQRARTAVRAAGSVERLHFTPGADLGRRGAAVLPGAQFRQQRLSGAHSSGAGEFPLGRRPRRYTALPWADRGAHAPPSRAVPLGVQALQASRMGSISAGLTKLRALNVTRRPMPKIPARLLHPRYWPTWIALGLLRAFEPLPFPVLLWLGRRIGGFASRLPLSFVRIA